MRFQQNVMLYGVFLLLAFPSFYFSYKFGNPEPLAHDFFQYYYLYKDFDISHVIAPHNMRLAGAYIVHVFYKLNFNYQTATAFDAYASWGFLKQVYFNALLFNYLCVAATSLVIFKLVNKTCKDLLLSLVAGLLYLSGFGTLFYELMPLTDAFSVLLCAVAFYYYLYEKWLVLPLLGLFIFQREYLLIAFATLAFIDFIIYKKRYYFFILSSAILCFMGYLVLRKTFFYTPHLDHQASLNYYWNSLTSLNYSLSSYLKQLVLTLNLLFLYFGILIYKKIKKIRSDSFSFFKVLFLFFQINFICHIAGHGNNCGRYFYLISPLILFLSAKEILPLLGKKNLKRLPHFKIRKGL